MYCCSDTVLLQCTRLHCTDLHWTAGFSHTLHSTALTCNAFCALDYSAPTCNELQGSIIYCTLLHWNTLYFDALHRTALHCTALHCAALSWPALHCTVLCSTALDCTALHYHTALHCTALHQTFAKSICNSPLFNKPGVAGAVLQSPPPFINLVIN